MLKLLDKIDMKRGRKFEGGMLFEGRKYAIGVGKDIVGEDCAWLYKKLKKARGGP